MGAGISKIIINCVTKFIDDPLVRKFKSPCQVELGQLSDTQGRSFTVFQSSSSIDRATVPRPGDGERLQQSQLERTHFSILFFSLELFCT